MRLSPSSPTRVCQLGFDHVQVFLYDVFDVIYDPVYIAWIVEADALDDLALVFAEEEGSVTV